MNSSSRSGLENVLSQLERQVSRQMHETPVQPKARGARKVLLTLQSVPRK